MPNRIVRDAILTSESVSGLDWAEEVFYRRLMSVVDDYGRSEANPQLLRSRCYPLQVDKVRVADISRWMAACQKAGLIAHYEVSGKWYLQIEKFGQQQRSPSKHPPPSAEPLLAIDSRCQQTPSNEHLGVSVVVVEDGGVSRSRAKRSLPVDFSVSSRVRDWAKEKGHTRLEEHLEAFKAKAQAKGYQYADWDAAFMSAVRENWAKLGPPVADRVDETRDYLAEQKRHANEAVPPPAEVLAKLAELKGRLHS
jgi:hypothetical protein